MKVLKYSLFVKHPSDFNPKLGARQAEDFNQESSHSFVQSMNLLATCLEIRTTLSPGIQRKNPSSHKAKSSRKGCDKKQGHSRLLFPQNLKRLIKNPFENKILVCLSLLPIKASHKRDGGRLGLILG